MADIECALTDRIKRTPSVESFRFKPQSRLQFVPGQFLQLLFDKDNPGNKELNKYLSFSCGPAAEYIEVTKRLSGSLFSQNLKSLKKNDKVTIKAPMGNTVFKDEYKKIGFLIGGIGITPVISIIEYIMDKKLPTDVWLFYTNRTEEEIAFKKELDGWARSNSNIKILYTVTDCQPKSADCLIGRIEKNLLIEKIEKPADRIYYVYGPPKMAEAMVDILYKDMGCTKENVKKEMFIGY